MLSRLRGVMTRLWTPLADALLRRGVSPDAVTITGTLVVVVTALWAFPTGHLLLGGLLIAVFTLTDSLDGVMARRAGRSSPWGAFLDSTLDRFGDGAIFAGLVLWYTGGGGSRLTAVLALACLVLGSIVPYARARAEGLGMTAAVGIAERAERLVAVIVATILVGAGLPDVVMTVVLGLLAAASAVTVVQRMATVRRQVREAAP
ncbi:CDP-alcohol phosphatidyltransferase family protein [Cellulomonas sp. zg-ZUI222]|uniref:Phosphatidylinositol phosphate synthase n=1 Tax=Cellulomonas wangleii TaxID=2816956 RepID=A0ABX8D961_9CELL|nr:MULTISPECIES: CDP-alcohol phosphatidyltransferase family protein [Cellulomonas]MBO0900413.1 CDP-alcohol phosphatidyltransferase family protein [Cellulomonas sp. zg-ZUI22]MBO0922757.1 CDP-alcohol phosphatidyltransferase family protein [Cellulomonas wangleii]MBO0926378.1 CDP-alcohol phosphatidyltransferase family protein [Cellulomonas wangleii]QVI63944.1 CDP-alcohol phosphatidyltransferase family protein [Cellulomonas wangleii]